MIEEIVTPHRPTVGLLELARARARRGLEAAGSAAERLRRRLPFDLRNFLRATHCLLTKLGVPVRNAALRASKWALNNLFEASAEVGEWLAGRSPAVQEYFRSSHFL